MIDFLVLILSTCPENKQSLMVPVKVAALNSGAQQALLRALWNMGNLCLAQKSQFYIEIEKLEWSSQDQTGSCLMNTVVSRPTGVLS